jgi:hypothetical protein
MNAARIFPGSASAWTVPLVQQSGTGGLQIDDAQIASSGSSGVAVRFATDTIYNVLGNVVLGAGWTTSVAAYVNGIYGPFAPTLNPVFGGTVTFTGAVNGFSFAPVVGGSTTDLSKQICLFAGAAYGFGVTANRINYNVPAASTHAFIVGGSDMGLVNANGITSNGLVQIGGISGPNWTQGSAAPAATAPVGSLYSRVGGAVGATLYVSRGGGTWAPVAGV